jgi:hypothetical protein
VEELTDEMQHLTEEKIQLSDQLADLNEILASQQSKMLSLEEDYNFRQSEMSAHIDKQEKQRDELDKEVENLKQKIHLLASDMRQEGKSDVSSVFRGLKEDNVEANPNELKMQTWRMETTPHPNSVYLQDLQQRLKLKEMECDELGGTVLRLTAENDELREENLRLRSELQQEKEGKAAAPETNGAEWASGNGRVKAYSSAASLSSGFSSEGMGGESDLFISNLTDLIARGDGGCICDASPIASNAEQIDFYLPRLRVFCPCGKHSVAGGAEMDDPTALSIVLRGWQVDFLSSCNIPDSAELVLAVRERSTEVARQMRKWRRKNRLPLMHTASCAVALQIWSRTCVRVIKSVKDQEATGRVKPVLPSFMEFKVDADMRTVSSMGLTSRRSMSDDDMASTD